ncbi:hypothetical protein ElyMa_000853300 [Elysia marginata]|uniref:Shugoshin C-terminal domain-containing protein n=1 Tax=Elysia marginata TaxID=1093978 RepID=A0AAV4H5D8_9GAST|nr:hypothetical protein ElyMa_000853300 [Elysia marginata]
MTVSSISSLILTDRKPLRGKATTPSYTGVVVGIVGIFVLVLSTITCICCSRSASDRRLSSYSSVKDTVQLEDLLTKPVLADPESVFSEPSIHYNWTPSASSNKSPSADSALRPSSQLLSDSESEHFVFPSSPNKKSFTEELLPASQPNASQFLKKETLSMKQKSSVKSSHSKKQNDKQPASEKIAGGGKPPLLSKSSTQTTSRVEDTSVSSLLKNQEKHGVNQQPLERELLLPVDAPDWSSNSISKLKDEESPTETNIDQLNDKVNTKECPERNSQVVKSVNQKELEVQPREYRETRPNAKHTFDNQNNDKNLINLSPTPKGSESKEENPEKDCENVPATACESTSMKEKTKHTPLEKLKLPETPGLHTFIANPSSSRLRKARENNLKYCEPNHQQSILTPGRCSFSHEAGHTANGNSKSISPLMSMSPVQERRFRSEGSASSSPVTSPSPIDSPEVFRKARSLTQNADTSNLKGEIEEKSNNARLFSQTSSLQHCEGKIPIQIAATLDGSSHRVSSSNIQANITPARVNIRDQIPKSEDYATLRRSTSEAAADTAMQSRDVKTFSLNLQIDFHFQNAEGIPTLAPSGLKNTPNNKELMNTCHKHSDRGIIKASRKNVWPDLCKKNESAAYNDATRLESKHKRKILEKSFAEKTVADGTDVQFPANRKRRSEPVMSFFEVTSTSVSGILSPGTSEKFKETRISSKRTERHRRSFPAGERTRQHTAGKKLTRKKELEDNENAFECLVEGGNHKRRRFQSSEHVTEPAREVDSLHADEKEMQDKSIEEELDITTGNSKGEKVHTNVNDISAASLNTLLNKKQLSEKKDGPAKENMSERRRTIPPGRFSEFSFIVTRELSRSDPVIYIYEKCINNEGESLQPFCQGSLDKCLSGYPATQLEGQVEQKPLLKQPVVKPKPKPRGGVVTKAQAHSQSLDRNLIVPKAKPRLSKSMEKLCDKDVEEKISETTQSEQNLTTEAKTVSQALPDTAIDDKLRDIEISQCVPVERRMSSSFKKYENDQDSPAQSETVGESSEQVTCERGPDGVCVMRKETESDNKSEEKTTVPEIEVSDDSDYDNPWDSLDGAVQRASIRYNRRPSRIAAGVDTKTLLLQSAEDLGRLLEQAEKRRQLRQAAAKSTCPEGENLLSPGSSGELPSVGHFTRSSPFRHTVKGLVSTPLSGASKSNESVHQDFPPPPKYGKQFKNELPGRSQSLMKRNPQMKNAVDEEELVAFRAAKPINCSPPTRTKSLSGKEAAKMLSPGTKKRIYKL